MSEFDRYLAIAGGVIIACFAMYQYPSGVSIALVSAALTGIFGVAGSGGKAA